MGTSKRGRRRGVAATLALIVLAPVLATTQAPAGGVPSGFEDTLVATVSQPVDLAWTPTGQMLVATKSGALRVLENDSLLTPAALDLSGVLCTDGERGLLGVAVHPQFSTNRFIYLYYTFQKHGGCNESSVDGPVNRVSRFVLPPSNIIDPLTELVLFNSRELNGIYHNGGDVSFGKDGFLYATLGDGTNSDLSGDADNLFGTVVRLTDDGDIPAGNPFSGPDGVRCNVDGQVPAGSPAGSECEEIFALGLRNPFRFALDPDSPTTRFFVNDVGQNDWEEIDELTAGGDDFGWNDREGPCSTATSSCTPDPAFTEPVHWYEHDVAGGSITGGAFVPSGVWPSQYEDTYIFADYVHGKIYLLEPGGPDCRLCDPPTSDFTQSEFSDAESVVAMAFGPHQGSQALYYLTLDHEIRRIVHTATSNGNPTAVATASPQAGPLPLSVDFDASASTDPDLDTLTYEWDFKDGSPIATEESPTHEFSVGGTYWVELTVDDGEGGQDSTSVRIDAGNRPPEPAISAPTPSHEFFVGESLTLTGSAFDPEDGLLDDVDLAWEVRQHHNTHWHPYLALTPGNNLSITTPAPEDFIAATNSYLELRLTATDSDDLSATVSQTVNPSAVDVTIETDPDGRTVLLDGFGVTGDQTVLSWEGHELTVDATPQSAGGSPWVFGDWSDGGGQRHDVTIPGSPITLEASFLNTTRIIPGQGSINEDDAGSTTLDIPVTLAVESDQTVTADWSTFDFSTTVGDDYPAASGQVVFTPGDTVEIVSLTIYDDGEYELDEALGIQVNNPTNAVIGGVYGLGFGTIFDDDPEPKLTPGWAVPDEGDGAPFTVDVPVILDGPSPFQTSADWTTVSYSATSPADYEADSGQVVFAPGQTSTSVTVTINPDDVPESNEGFVLAFSSLDGLRPGGFYGLGIVIIHDDD